MMVILVFILQFFNRSRYFPAQGVLQDQVFETDPSNPMVFIKIVLVHFAPWYLASKTFEFSIEKLTQWCQWRGKLKKKPRFPSHKSWILQQMNNTPSPITSKILKCWNKANLKKLNNIISVTYQNHHSILPVLPTLIEGKAVFETVFDLKYWLTVTINIDTVQFDITFCILSQCRSTFYAVEKINVSNQRLFVHTSRVC